MDTKPHNQAEGSAHDYVPTPEEIAIGYEKRDTHLRAVLIFVTIFVISVAATFLISRGIEMALMHDRDSDLVQDHTPHPLSAMNDKLMKIPAGPLLEPSEPHPMMPQQDLAEVQDREHKMLSTYQWVDKEHGVARIPLAEAQAMAIEHGLMVKLPATQPSAPPTIPPASSAHGPGGTP